MITTFPLARIIPSAITYPIISFLSYMKNIFTDEGKIATIPNRNKNYILTMINQQNISEQITTVSGDTKKSTYEIMHEIWRYRALMWLLCKKEIKTRYTQTLLGSGWFILYPLITAGVFSIIFGLMIKIPSNGLPYVIFYLSALITWYAFIHIVNTTLNMLPGNISLISKVYFPRVILSGSNALIAMLDFSVGCALIIFFSFWFHTFHYQTLLVIPIVFFILATFGLGLGLFLAPINNSYRDINHFTPFALQCLYYGSPIIYPISHVPAWAKPWFMINPIGGMVVSFRAALSGHWPNFTMLLITLLTSFLFFVLGAMYFIRCEKDVVDNL